MNFPISLHLRKALPLLLLSLLGLAGCGRSARFSVPEGKDGPARAAVRRQSEFDFYCALRPVETGSGLRPFVPTLYDAMKANGYKVYILRYRFERPVDGFGGFGGYGFRDFFGSPGAGALPGGRVTTGQRAVIVWETHRGEFFLVDQYYSSPLWLDGATWLEKVRFYDPAAVSVEVEKS